MSKFEHIKYLYRYDDGKLENKLDEVKPRCYKYKVLKATECGVQINGRFVNLQCNKKWAYPTIGEARIHYLGRKKNHLKILKSQMYMLAYNYGNAKANNWDDSLLHIEF